MMFRAAQLHSEIQLTFY